jgi:hypothetical protein
MVKGDVTRKRHFDSSSLAPQKIIDSPRQCFQTGEKRYHDLRANSVFREAEAALSKLVSSNHSGGGKAVFYGKSFE